MSNNQHSQQEGSSNQSPGFLSSLSEAAVLPSSVGGPEGVTSSNGVGSGNPPVTPFVNKDGNYIDANGNKMHVNRMGSAVPYDESKDTVPVAAEGFNIGSPVELLYLIDEDIANGTTKLHPWQLQFMFDFADERHTKDLPYLAEVRACNGSGKDKYVVAACIVWLCMRYRNARGVATNGSGVQLDNQTEAYVDMLCNKANKFFRQRYGWQIDVWKRNYRYYECILTESPIVLFATDEPNKAEGFHPLVPGGKMAIFASEAKAIPDDIFSALTRCTGFTHRVDVSTPGLPMGVFYDRCQTAIKRKEIADIKEVGPTDCLEYHITAYDCPHITTSEIENFAKDLPGGKNSAIFKSGVLAEFGSTDEMVVIPHMYIWKAYREKGRKWLSEAQNKAGLDLSDGGDETVLVVRNGNRHLKTIPFKFDNTEDTVAFLSEKFIEFELTNSEAYIFADCGGLGKPILDRLKRMGWANIRYVDNRAKPRRPKTYLNLGAEVWFHTRLLLERSELIIEYDDLLVKQLASRFYKIKDNKHQLLSKIEMRSRGYKSPDRADAFVLSFWDYKSTFEEKVPEEAEEILKTLKVPLIPKPVNSFTQQDLLGGKNDSIAKRLGKRQDFSVLQEQLDAYNRSRKEQKYNQTSTELIIESE